MGYVNRSITCINHDGIEMTFGEKGLNPFLLVEADGCYLAQNTVTISENTMTDGGTFQGSIAKVRNIVLTLKDIEDHVENRNFLYQLFKSNELGTLIFQEDDEKRKIEYYVESITSTGEYGARTYTVSLLCPDPFFYALNDVIIYMSSWEAGFEFIHEFVAEGEELGYRVANTISEIFNENGADGVGMTIKILAEGTVTNPEVTRIESNESITVGTDARPFSMVSGDVLTITTTNNNKHVYLTHDGVTEEVNQYLTEDSVFIQLMRGINTIGYSAKVGEGNMLVEISYKLKYVGA